MNGIDIAILVILGIFMLKGLLRGLIKELFSLVGLVAGSLAAFHLHPPLAQWLQESFGFAPLICVISAFLVLFLTILTLFTAAGYLVSRSISLLLLDGVNLVAGGCFGLFQGVVALALVLFGLSLGSLPDALHDRVERAQLAPPFVTLGENMFTRGQEAIKDRL
ncbi:MAG: colicin V production protein [Desulfuromonas sp.]|nr:MAG: colicin V production protein [Desulfuromonas sp.]